MLYSVPVSAGELFDKLSILQIKRRKISDEKKLECIDAEILALEQHLNREPALDFYMKMLTIINEEIWDDQEKIRGMDGSHPSYGTICAKIISDNDRRFRVKTMINNFLSSTLKEQKSHAEKKCFVWTHTGVGDHINSIGAVRKLSTMYDLVYLAVLPEHQTTVAEFYADCASIVLVPIASSSAVMFQPVDFIERSMNTTMKPFGFCVGDRDVYCAGRFNTKGEKNKPSPYIPDFIYLDFGLKPSDRTEYFYMGTPAPETNIGDMKIIFVHRGFGNKKTQPDLVSDKQIAKWCKDPTKVVIDPNFYHYKTECPASEIAKNFVDKPISAYANLIREAQEIYLTDSCFFCLALYLPLKATKAICCPRGKEGKRVDYTYLDSRFKYI